MTYIYISYTIFWSNKKKKKQYLFFFTIFPIEAVYSIHFKLGGNLIHNIKYKTCRFTKNLSTCYCGLRKSHIIVNSCNNINTKIQKKRLDYTYVFKLKVELDRYKFVFQSTCYKNWRLCRRQVWIQYRIRYPKILIRSNRKQNRSRKLMENLRHPVYKKLKRIEIFVNDVLIVSIIIVLLLI